jgi:hypothetical protein
VPVKALRVPNWSRYMPADAKKCTVMQWVAVPIAHDGLGYIELMAHPDGIRMIGGWLLILQTAARCPVRGLLVSDSGRILRAREIALKTRAQESDITACIETLLDNGWLEEIDGDEAIRIASGQHPDGIRTTGQDRTGENRRGEDAHPSPGKPANAREALVKHLRKLGLPATPETTQEWADLCSGRASCTSAANGLSFITWAVDRAKADGVNLQYPRQAALYADRWSDKGAA